MKGSRARLVALGCLAAIAVAMAAGAADGHTSAAARQTSPRKHKPGGYKAKGHSNIYKNEGQVCFTATWVGNGGWSTDLHSTSTGPAPGQSSSQTDQDSSSYSWDAKPAPNAGVCAFDVIEGYKPHPIEAFDAGFLRLALMGDDRSESTNTTPIHETCDKSLITHGDGSRGTGGFTSQIRGDSLVFTATVFLGEPPVVQPGCAIYALPGSLGNGGDFLSASSVPVPIALFKTARTVSVAFASDGSRVPHDCGLSTTPRAGSHVDCSEKGTWQGTLTFTVYHG
jgi:hypothetical protein